MSTTSWPIATGDVTAYLGVTPAGVADTAALDQATAAAVGFVNDRVLDNVDPIPAAVTPAQRQGAIMLAARWYGRRSSTSGIAGFGDVGVAYVMRDDPDVARLLGLTRPGIA